MTPAKYVNNRGDAVDLNANGCWFSLTDVLAWSLDTEELNGAIASFSRGTQSRTMQGATYTEAARRRIYEVPARDVAESTPGRLYFGDWYMVCYVTGSTVSGWWDAAGKAGYELTVTTDDPQWHRDTPYVFTEREEGGQGLDYPHDYAYDYGYSSSTTTVRNRSILPADLVIRMYGPCENPSVEIGGNEYRLDVSLAQGDYAVIDTYSKTAYVVRLDGDVENAFPDIAGDYREGSGSYVFQKLPEGSSDLVWPGTFDTDVVVVETRDEPEGAS